MHLYNTLPPLIILLFSLLSEATQELKVLSSELDNLCEDDTKRDACNQFNTFESAQAKNNEETGYLICHQDSSNLSGGERKAEILNLARKNELDMNLSDQAIYNRDGAYCSYGSMAPSTAVLFNGINDEKITAQPLSTMAKIRTGAFDELSSTSDRFPKVTIHIDLCPGTANSDTASARLASSFVEKTRSDLETHFNYFQALESISDTKDRFDALFEDASNADFDCLNIINEAVIELDFISSVQSYQIRYTLSNIADESKICHDFFVVALATQTEVCSVEKQARINLFNDQSQWILQSGAENTNQRPFFDKGISGAGQVVQVSEYRRNFYRTTRKNK